MVFSLSLSLSNCDLQGIIGDVKLGAITITNWTHIYYQKLGNLMDSVTNHLVKNKYTDEHNNHHDNGSIEINKTQLVTNESPPPQSISPSPEVVKYPAIFGSSFQLPVGVKPSDTFLNLSNFTKGIVGFNGHLLGKYWPHTGPQVTLYVPGVWFKSYPDYNLLTILETLQINSSSSSADKPITIQFQSQPILNGSIPFSNVKTYDYWLSKLQVNNQL